MEPDYTVAFTLITHAGSSRSESMSALQAARGGDYVGARAHLEAAEAGLREAHHAQTELVQQEAGGTPVPVNVILVHAQDHLTSAIVVKELAEEIVHMYERFAPAETAAPNSSSGATI